MPVEKGRESGGLAHRTMRTPLAWEREAEFQETTSFQGQLNLSSQLVTDTKSRKSQSIPFLLQQANPSDEKP